MYTIQGAPTKTEILLRCDHIVAENPGLRVVDAPPGSVESNLDTIAHHLDDHPNFGVDLAGRFPYLTAIPREVVVAVHDEISGSPVRDGRQTIPKTTSRER